MRINSHLTRMHQDRAVLQPCSDLLPTYLKPSPNILREHLALLYRNDLPYSLAIARTTAQTATIVRGETYPDLLDAFLKRAQTAPT